MTTIDGLLVPPDEPASDSGTDAPTSADARRPRVWLRIVLSFVVGFGLALAVAGAGLYAYDASHEGLVLPGVHIGGVDVSAMSYSEAAAAVHAAYDRFGEGTVVVKTTAGDITIPFSDFDRRPDVGPLIDEAMAVGRTGTVLERALSEVRLALQPTVIQPKMVFDDALLGRWIQRGVEAYEQPAIDASITMGPKGIEATPPQFGRTYDAAVATTAAVAVDPSATTVPAPTTVPATVATTVPPPPPPPYAGVIAIGDSVMLGAKAALEQRMPGIYVDAAVSRQVKGGAELAAALKAQGDSIMMYINPFINKITVEFRRDRDDQDPR